jgi:hypothetical protein
MAFEVARGDLELALPRAPRHLDQESFALVQRRDVDALELLAQALALLAIDGDGGELHLGGGESGVERQRLAEVRRGIEKVEAHPGVEAGFEGGQRCGRLRGPFARARPKQERQGYRRGGDGARRQDKHQFATSHAAPPPSRAMATRVMSS